MLRREFLKRAGMSGAAIALAEGTAAPGVASKQRNVVLYVGDDHGTNDAGCYGNPLVNTPGLDQLAREGVRFTHAFCTTPSCSPSRSVILSGMHNHTTGQYGLAHAKHHFVSFPDIKSLPNTLADAGYRTLCAGKHHVLPEEIFHFDAYVPTGVPRDMADTCRNFIGDASSPFFLYFCTVEPHRPFKREGFTPIDADKIKVPPHLPDTPECREELAHYYASVERADSGLLRLIEILKETGRWDDTLVIYISDNGMPWPGAKTNLYEPGIRLPCVVRNPESGRRGQTCDAMVSWIDITPTVLEFCQVPPADSRMQGQSFLHAMEEESSEGWDEVYCSHTFHEVTMYYPMRAIRTRKHKLIWNIAHGLSFPFASDLWNSKTWQATLNGRATHYGKRTVEAYTNRPAFELYDLDADPDEIHNLADGAAHAPLLAELKEKIRRFQEKTGDPWLLKWERE